MDHDWKQIPNAALLFAPESHDFRSCSPRFPTTKKNSAAVAGAEFMVPWKSAARSFKFTDQAFNQKSAANPDRRVGGCCTETGFPDRGSSGGTAQRA